jgi:protocatechuate 3,4-dioxygenase, beta subunit
MVKARDIIFLSGIVLVLGGCQTVSSEELPIGEDRRVGGKCEGCEATLEFDHARLSAHDTLPGADPDAPILKVAGTIYQNDGVTPASKVILYVYHAGQDGQYTVINGIDASSSLNSRNKGLWATRHGSLRGWIRTDESGQYSFLTQRPAPSPKPNEPARIHMYIKEPGIAAYAIDDLLFENDPHVTGELVQTLEERCGSGVVRAVQENDIWVVQRDIILGLNVPGY